MKIRRTFFASSLYRLQIGPFATAFGFVFAGSQIGAAVTLTDGVNLGINNTVPTGSNSVASGFGNHVDNGGFALGEGNVADNHSIAIGYESRANWGSLVGGQYNTVDADSYFSLLYGEGNYAGYTAAGVLFGNYNVMGLQWGSAAIGNSNSMQFPFGKSGSANILLGHNNRIIATVPSAPDEIVGTVLIGDDNDSSSTMAFAFGKGNIGQTDTVTVGTYAQTVSNASLIVGNGTATNARSNGLVVLRSGEVQISGSLVVGGSPVISQGTANSYLQSLGYFTQSGLAAALLSTAPPLSSMAWKNAFVPRGAVTNGGLLAVGDGANATQSNAVAIGSSSQANGSYSIAMGLDSRTGSLATEATALGGGMADGAYSLAAIYGTASGDASFATQVGFAYGQCSIALSGLDWVCGGANIANGENSTAIGGINNKASGFSTFASGYWTEAPTAYSVVLGSMNASPSGSATEWVETDALFQLGNGWAARSAITPSSSLRSNAITTLKNGQTTLTNKAWKADPAVAPTASNSNGEALIVEGHTRLKGKVVIEQAQGDISMGIYE